MIADYRVLSPQVAERFARIKQRPVRLTVRGLKKCFVSDGVERAVFDGLTFDVHRREFICVIGPSGCGKSTFIRIAAGLDECSGGELLLDGKPIGGPGPDRGMVFQGYTLFPWLTVKRNVMFGLEMQGKGRETADVEARQWLDMVGLSKFENAYPHELSGGMAQRVVIAMALVGEPRVTISDDATSGLDVTVQAQVLDLALELLRERQSATLMITRDLGIVANYCDQVAVVYRGRVLESADVRSFFRDPRHPYSVELLEAFSYERRDGAVATPSLPYDSEELELREVSPGHLVREVAV
jgi:NitT/TauT family transport system ATP-binding protein